MTEKVINIFNAIHSIAEKCFENMLSNTSFIFKDVA